MFFYKGLKRDRHRNPPHSLLHPPLTSLLFQRETTVGVGGSNSSLLPVRTSRRTFSLTSFRLNEKHGVGEISSPSVCVLGGLVTRHRPSSLGESMRPSIFPRRDRRVFRVRQRPSLGSFWVAGVLSGPPIRPSPFGE